LIVKNILNVKFTVLGNIYAESSLGFFNKEGQKRSMWWFCEILESVF